MGGLIFLVLCFALGFVLCSILFPGLKGYTQFTFLGTPINISDIFVRVPAWFVTGTLFMTWTSYILACFLVSTNRPLLYADLFTELIACIIIAVGVIFLIKKRNAEACELIKRPVHISEILLFFCIGILFGFLIHDTFFIEHDNLYIGLTVFSDFTPHVSMIRSFSFQQNFPTQYSVCAGADVKYHFMFQYLVGNLEYLGMRIDHAFNILSWISIMCMYSLLYVMTVRFSGKRLAGHIACVLLTFRSSLSVFYFLNDSDQGIWNTLISNFDFIGCTDKEDWGLWNLNVYLNQRHLPFGLCIMLLILLLFLPSVYSAFSHSDEHFSGPAAFFSRSMFSREGWSIKDWKKTIASGIMLGALGFFNGAVLLATVIILFFLAIASDHRLEYLFMAMIGGCLSILQTRTFIDGQIFTPEFNYGFLAEKGTLLSTTDYIIKLLGILPIVLLFAFFMYNSVRKYIMFAFSMPIIFAFTVSLTPDIAVNHKYIMISVMLLDVFAACFITLLFSRAGSKQGRMGRRALAPVAVILLLCLTATGIYDTYIIFKRNNPVYSIVNSTDSPLTDWLHKNCSSDDLFLTANYYLVNNATSSELLLSGVSLYNAWEYFGWSAGYDTSARDFVTNRIYGCNDKSDLVRLVDTNHFDYIVVDAFNRDSDYYELNEELIASTYKIAYTVGEGYDKLTIYRTHD